MSEDLQCEQVDWGQLNKKASSPGGGRKSGGGGGSGVQYMKWVADQNYNIRILGGSLQFYKFFVRGSDGVRTAQVRVADGQTAEQYIQAQTGKELRGQMRFAVNVIDRDDGDTIKVMEGPYALFKQFAAWADLPNNQGKDPGGMDASDWRISVIGEFKNREYTAMPTGDTPLTAEYAQKVRDDELFYDLPKLYKPVAPEELHDRLFGERENKNDSGPASGAEPQVATPVAEAPQAVVAGEGTPSGSNVLPF
jgi:hypothetical protein